MMPPMRLRLLRGEVLQINGPVTGKRYTFLKQVGRAPIVDVDDVDGPPMIAKIGGCCGMKYRLFQQEPEQEPEPEPEP